MTRIPAAEEAPMRRSSQRHAWLAAAACAIAGIAVFHWFGNANRGYIATDSLFWWWVSQWINPASENEHGWLILGISVWLLWRNLNPENAPRAPGESSRTWVAPLAALIGGLALHAVGFVAQQARISIAALLVFSWGVLRLGGGRRWGAAAAFPVAFLVFAVPLNVLDSLGFWLRMWVVDAGTAIAHVAGVEVVRSGTQLLGPDGTYNYDVVAACSGVRSLVALAALSLLIGYLNFRSWVMRFVVLLSCFPLVYLGNVARIAAIVFAAEAGGPRWGDFAHSVMGYAVFVIVLGGVYALVSLLRRWNKRPVSVDATAAPVARAGNAVTPRVAAVAAGAVIVVCLVEVGFLRHVRNLPPRGAAGVVLDASGQAPAELPSFLGTEWVGVPAEVTAIEREVLPPDTGYSRKMYVASRDGRRVFLSLVLSGRDRTSIHRPEICLVGQGWSITGRAEHAFSYGGEPGLTFPATVLRVVRERSSPQGKTLEPHLVVYWFVGGDRIVASHWERLTWDTLNRVARGRADRWAYVLMQTDASDGEAQALARMQRVLTHTLPVFQRPSGD